MERQSRLAGAPRRNARLLVCVAVVGGLLAGSVTPSRAEIFGAATASGDWSVAATWVDSSAAPGVPGTTDSVSIGAPGYPVAEAVSAATVTLSANVTVANVNLGTVGSIVGSGTLDLAPGGHLSTVTLELDGTNGGSATLGLTGGVATVNGEFSLRGTGATLARTTGSFTTASLVLADGATLTTDVADSITSGVQLTNGAVLTLGESLSLSGGLSVSDATLELENLAVTAGGTLTLAEGAVVDRGATMAGAITAGGFLISGATTFTAQVGDSFSGAGSVTGGGTFTADTPVSGLASLGVSGANSALVANSQITDDGDGTFSVSSGGRLTINAGLSAQTLTITDGTLELNGGMLSTSTLLLGDADTAATVSRGGGTVDVGSATVEGGTSLVTLAGDAFDSLTVSDGIVTLDQVAGQSTGLWIRTASDNALAIDVAGGLVLNFDGSGGAHDWALKWSGDRLAALQALLDEAYVTVNQASYQVFYDEGENATFVAVPEPAPGALVVLAVAARAVFIRRHARR